METIDGALAMDVALTLVAVSENEPILRFFHSADLPTRAQPTAISFAELAGRVVQHLPRSAERTVTLRKLLEAKDCAVRALQP